MDDKLEYLWTFFSRYGDIYRVRRPSSEADTYVINDPAAVKQVLVSNHRNYTKGIGIDRVKILLGNGIMVSEGELWKRQRRMIQPCFQRAVIERFCSQFHNRSLELVGQWSRLAACGEPVNITAEMSRFTLQIILDAVFSTDLERLSQDTVGNPFHIITSESGRDLRFAVKFRALVPVVAGLIEQRRREGSEYFDFLSMLMAARDRDTGAPMDERQLIDEVLTLVVAGHETTASALNWVWYLLSMHPDAEERLHQEVDSRECPEKPLLDDLFTSSYAEQVIREALRLYPPGWLFTRRAIAHDRLGDYEVPPGTDIFISPYLLHRHPAHWPEADAFRPERFEPEVARSRERYVYIPFVAGPRHCVGESFAMAEMLILLRVAARRFRLRMAGSQTVELDAGVNLRTRHPLFMQLQPR